MAIETERLCRCADPENCTERVPGYRCKKDWARSSEYWKGELLAANRKMVEAMQTIQSQGEEIERLRAEVKCPCGVAYLRVEGGYVPVCDCAAKNAVTPQQLLG
jgi:hypothetical protein